MRSRMPAALVVLALLTLPSCFGNSTTTAPRNSAVVPTVRGTVSFENHSPAPDVFAWIENNPAYPLVDLSNVSSSFMTDSSGAFEFFNVPAGHFYVLAGIARDANPTDLFNFSATDSLVAIGPVAVTAPNAPSPPVNLTLIKPGAFRGRVLDDASGKPLEALVITPGALTISSSDSTGAYLLPGVAPGSWPVLAVFFVDSVTAWGGQQMATLVAPGDTVTVADIRVGPRAVPMALMPGGVHGRIGTGAGGHMAALRERRNALLRSLR